MFHKRHLDHRRLLHPIPHLDPNTRPNLVEPVRDIPHRHILFQDGRRTARCDGAQDAGGVREVHDGRVFAGGGAFDDETDAALGGRVRGGFADLGEDGGGAGEVGGFATALT